MKPNLLKMLGTKKVNAVLSIIIFFIIVICLFFSQPNTVVVSVKNDVLSLTYKSQSYQINVTDISSLNELKTFDIGSKVSGEESKNAKFGTWKNKSYGEYALAVDNKAEHYIVLKAKDNIYVFNFESTETTDSFYTALQNLIKEKK